MTVAAPAAPEDPRAVWRREASATLRLAAPIALTQLGQVVMMVTDVAMIGRLGRDALAASALSAIVYFLFFVLAFGLVMATAPLAAQAYGAHRPRRLRRVIRQGLWVAILVGVPGVAVLTLATEEMLVLLGQDPKIAVMTDAYLSTMAFSIPPAIGFLVLRNFVSALNRPVPALVVMLCGIPINALLDYGLIFGHFGLPRLELVGAGLATTLINVTMFVALLWIATRRPPFRRYRILGRFWRPDWSILRQIVLLGLPIAGIMLVEFGVFAAAVMLSGWIGKTALAAFQVAIQIPHITFMVPLGIGQAATVRVGHAVGRRDADGARRAGWMAMAVGGVFMTFAAVVILAIPETLALAFVDRSDPLAGEVVAVAVLLLAIAAAFQVVDGLQTIAAGALRGLNDTKIPMVLGAICYWGVAFVLAWFLGLRLGWGAPGIWIGLALGLGAMAFALTLRFWLLTRRGYIPAIPGSGVGEQNAPA